MLHWERTIKIHMDHLKEWSWFHWFAIWIWTVRCAATVDKSNMSFLVTLDFGFIKLW